MYTSPWIVCFKLVIVLSSDVISRLLATLSVCMDAIVVSTLLMSIFTDEMDVWALLTSFCTNVIFV